MVRRDDPSGNQVLRMAIPTCCEDDPTLARLVDEAATDVFLPGIGDQTGGRAAAAGMSGTAGGRSGCHGAGRRRGDGDRLLGT
jgi:hypothetical protein